MQIKRFFLIASLIIAQPVLAISFAERPEVQKFIEEISQQHNINKLTTINALSKIESSPEIIQKITAPYEALPWHKYKALYLSNNRIEGGIKFWRQYAKVLAEAEKKYGVPAEIIVAIIGVESTYGQNRGKYPVLQSLATLAFDYPPRANFFKQELKEYLLLIQEHNLDPLALTGSYAGAIGMPQFIASSYRAFAVDFDNSGNIDLVNNVAQVIGSVANYFKLHGWQPNQLVAVPAKIKTKKHLEITTVLNNDPRPLLSLDTLKQLGITPSKTIKGQEKYALLEFANTPENKEYWLGLPNFYVITRYNKSSNYAMAVYQLSQAIAKVYKKK